MNLKAKLCAIGTAILTVLTTVFYVLFQQKKDENKLLKEEAEKAKADADLQKAVSEKYVMEKKSHEELINKVVSNTDDSHDAAISLMHELSEKGKKRNGNS